MDKNCFRDISILHVELLLAKEAFNIYCLNSNYYLQILTSARQKAYALTNVGTRLGVMRACADRGILCSEMDTLVKTGGVNRTV